MYPGTYARLTPDKPAMIMHGTGEVITYRELDDRSAALAQALHDLGLRKGDVFALLSDNALESLVIYWAALRSGLYMTAVNRHLAPDEVAYILTNSGARVVIASAALADHAVQVHGLVGVVPAYAFGGSIPGFESYEELVGSAEGRRLPFEPRGGTMLYSSGTTGRPKGVKVPLPDKTVDQPDGLPIIMKARWGFGPDDIYLSPAPIYHAAPLAWCAGVHVHGGTVVMMSRFDAEDFLAAITEHRVTVAQVVPTMFVRLLQLDDRRHAYDTSSLRLVPHTAAPCPPDVKRAVIDWLGPVVLEYYSSTEGAGITAATSEEWLSNPGTVGRAISGTVRICDDEGRVQPAGAVGSVYFERSDREFEYHGDVEKTQESRHPEHPTWTCVGDIGYLDDDGFLYLTDRKAFMIISGGVNIYPQEVEGALALHPAIYDVAVIGIPDPEMGEQVKALVQLRPGIEGSPELARAMIEYTRERIAHFKAPRTVDFVPILPRTPTGKLVKHKLASLYGGTGAD